MEAFPKGKRRFLEYAGVGLLVWFLVGAILYPALTTLAAGVTKGSALTLEHYAAFFNSSAGLTVLKNTIVMGVLTMLICGVVGTGLAFCVHFFDFPCKNIVDKLLLLPVMMPGIIIVFAFVQLYGESGLVTKTIESLLGLEEAPYTFSGLPGILFIHALTQYVYYYITASLAIKQIDYSLIESARGLGASRLKVLTSVIRPSLAPALITSAAVTFMTGLGSFTAPSIMGGGYKVLSTQMLLAKANNYMGLAAVQAAALTSISLALFIFFRWYEKRKLFAHSVRGTPFQPIPLDNPLVKWSVITGTAILGFLILLPFFTVILLSFVDSGAWMVSIYPEKFCLDNYIDIFTKPRPFRPIYNSLVMSLAAAALCLAIAVPSSYVIEKTKYKVRWLIDVLVMLPWAMPAGAVAINIITANASPNIFAFNAVLVGSCILLPLGYFVRSLPIVVKITQISLQGLNDAYLDASTSLGASRSETFRKVVLPILSPGLLAGFILAFVRGIGEYNVSAFLYTASNKPISIAMVNAIFEYNIGLAMAYGALLILLTIVLSLVISKIKRG
ncbi:MAG: iron ABC transporter permease [Pseudomonadota bacterium]